MFGEHRIDEGVVSVEEIENRPVIVDRVLELLAAREGEAANGEEPLLRIDSGGVDVEDEEGERE